MNIPSAKQSPRLVGGVLFFYYLDTFTLQIELDMTDQDGVEIDATGTVEFVFYDDCHNKIKEFTLILLKHVYHDGFLHPKVLLKVFLHHL